MCPTCDHTRHSITKGVFWCPRCGTLNDEKPKLIERVRKQKNNNFEVAECIYKPESRGKYYETSEL